MKAVNIYKITNLVNGKIYIGQTVQQVQRRWTRHLQDAEKHEHDLHLYRAIRKYGVENFKIEHIATAENKTWGDYFERLYILIYGTLDPNVGYNMTSGGEGSLHREENKLKIAEKSREWWTVPGNRERASASRKGLLIGARNPMFGRHDLGRPHTEETRRHLSKNKKEQYKDPEFKEMMSKANRGKRHTEEGKANISAALQGNQYRKGIPHDEETKARIAASMRASWERKRLQKLEAA